MATQKPVNTATARPLALFVYNRTATTLAWTLWRKKKRDRARERVTSISANRRNPGRRWPRLTAKKKNDHRLRAIELSTWMSYSQNICRYPLVMLWIDASLARNPNQLSQRAVGSLLVAPVAVDAFGCASVAAKYARDFHARTRTFCLAPSSGCIAHAPDILCKNSKGANSRLNHKKQRHGGKVILQMFIYEAGVIYTFSLNL